MADENQARADQPETTQEAPGNNPDAVHSNQGNDDFADRVAKANTPEELARLTEEFLARGDRPAPTEEGEAEETASEPGDQTTGEDAETAEGDEGTPDTDKVEEKAQKQEKAEDDDEPEDDDGAQSKRIRVRPKADDKVGFRALEIQRRNRDLSLEECLERARAELGLTKTKPEADASKPEPESKKDDEPATLDEVDNRIKELRAQRKTAMTQDFDFEKVTALDEQIDALRDRREDLVRNEATKSAANTRSDYDTQFDAAQVKAAELYDFVRDANGAESKRMLEIDAQLKESGDPLYSDPQKPLVLARMVAREFSIAPKAKTTSPKPATAAKPAATAKPKNVAPIASGNSRTASTASNSAGQQLLEQADRIKSPAEMEEWLATLR